MMDGYVKIHPLEKTFHSQIIKLVTILLNI